MAQIKDVTVLGNGLLAITFEDAHGRDLRLFPNRADEAGLEALKAWTPGPDDVTVEVKVDIVLAKKLIRWSGERGITAEQLLRAFIFYIADNSRWLAEWKKNGKIEIPWDRESDIGPGGNQAHSKGTGYPEHDAGGDQRRDCRGGEEMDKREKEE